LTTILVIVLFVLVRTSGTTSYGGSSLPAIRSPELLLKRMYAMAATAASDGAYLLPVILIGIASVRLTPGAPGLRQWGVAVVILLCWTAPQLLVYSTRPEIWDYYYYPLVLGFAVLNAWAAWRIVHLQSRLLAAPLTVIAAIWLYHAWRDTSQEASRHMASIAALDRLVHECSRRIGIDRALVLAGSTADVYEPGIRILGGLGLEGRGDIRLLWLATDKSQLPFEPPLTRSWLDTAGDWRGSEQKIDAVCAATANAQPTGQELHSLIAGLGLQREDMTYDWHVWSWRQWAWTTRTESYACWFSASHR
jgi:hypothetical protein